MDEDLLQILSHPFSAGGIAIQSGLEDDPDSVLERKATQYLYGNSGASAVKEQDNAKLFDNFRIEPDQFLGIHFILSEMISGIYFSPDLPEDKKEIISTIAPELQARINDVKKFYKIYILTASNESLEKEAYRLERKFFEDINKPGQIPFIKLRRYYEKLKTFNEFARNIWRDIFKNLDALDLNPELLDFKEIIPAETRNEIYPLIRKTDSFLDAFRRFLEIQNEEFDSLTRSYKVEMNFHPGKVYTMGAFFGEEKQYMEDEKKLHLPEETEEEEEPHDLQEFEGSIARNIILETRQHKLAGSRILSVPILGSRDWNRTPDYRMEIPLDEYESSMETFRVAYHVNLPETTGKLPVNQNTILARKGMGAKHHQQYGNMIETFLEQIKIDLIETDYPGLDHPDVFLYHTGPGVFERILISLLRMNNLGEIYYMANRAISHEFPLPVIRKEIIFWWNGQFKELDRELVDSYLIFSRIIEMVKKDYRILYDEGSRQRKRDQPGAGYSGLDRWIRENRVRVFGVRKLEVFRRFIPDNHTVEESERSDDTMQRILTEQEPG